MKKDIIFIPILSGYVSCLKEAPLPVHVDFSFELKDVP
jgi:hypothetical protein